MPASQAPVLLEAVGDRYAFPCRIMAIIWEGATTAGDQVEIKDLVTGELLWPGRAADTNTYVGANFSSFNVGCQGFIANMLDSGRVLVYLAKAL